MELDATKRIRINDLLLRREAELVRVHQCEAKIERLLGAPYPFPAPQEAPLSFRKRKKLKMIKQTERAAAPPRIRPLRKNSEHAYRVQYLSRGERATTLQVDAKLVQAALRLETDLLRVVKVQTVAIAPDKRVETLDTLYEAPES